MIPKPPIVRAPRPDLTASQDIRRHNHADQQLHPETCLRCKHLTDNYRKGN